MTRYTTEQIGNTLIRELNARSKSTYALYVDQGEEHQPVLVGVDWGDCYQKTAELIAAGVSDTDIYGESDARDGSNWGQARIHLWLPSQRGGKIAQDQKDKG